MMWFERDDLCHQWLQDFIHAEMRLIRASYRGGEFTADTPLNSAQADIDSIELVDLASSLYLYLDAEANGILTRLKVGRTFGDWLAFSRSAAAISPNLAFFSSGSNGVRKLSTHPYQALLDEVHALIDRFQLQRATRIVCAVPTHHIYGFLFGTLLPAVLGVPAARLSMPSAAGARASLENNQNTVLVATPKLVAALIRDDVGIKHQTTVLTAGSALPDAAFDAMKSLGVHALVDIYGSSETAGVATRSKPSTFALLPRYQRDGVSLFDHASNRIVRAPDHLQWCEHTSGFTLGARVDRQVQVAGINVCLEKVESVLRAAPNVVDARVVLQGKSVDARIHARVVVAQEFELETLRDEINVKLLSAERPIEIEVHHQP
jgi:long-chain acyl-CoA synthetase